jgi:tRNA (adenine-N(1)-)-methyltransferase non-catalytic subunit
VRKRDFSADLLIGAPYGSVYEAEGGKVQLVESGELLERIDVDTGVLANSPHSGVRAANRMTRLPPVRAMECAGSGLDNRNTKDTHLSQKLTQGAIVDMKSSGMTGTELISALISNSSTFAAKTSFAQEKYIKKKQLK